MSAIKQSAPSVKRVRFDDDTNNNATQHLHHKQQQQQQQQHSLSLAYGNFDDLGPSELPLTTSDEPQEEHLIPLEDSEMTERAAALANVDDERNESIAHLKESTKEQIAAQPTGTYNRIEYNQSKLST
jgi:hypothetical protein